jgi:hypothetical protein
MLIEPATRIALTGIELIVAQERAIEQDDRKAVAAYLLVTALNVSGATAGRVMSCTRQNVSKLIRRVEAARDHAAFDAAVERARLMIIGAQT